jgi:hypothetical protein
MEAKRDLALARAVKTLPPRKGAQPPQNAEQPRKLLGQARAVHAGVRRSRFAWGRGAGSLAHSYAEQSVTTTR